MKKTRRVRSDLPKEDSLEALLEKARRLPPMTFWEKRAQAISYVYGDVLIDRPEYEVNPGLWQIRRLAADAFDRDRGLVAEPVLGSRPPVALAKALRVRSGKAT